MIVLKGDTVELVSGETAEVIEIWGIARTWYKLRTSDGKTCFGMDNKIESIIRRPGKKGKART